MLHVSEEDAVITDDTEVSQAAGEDEAPRRRSNASGNGTVAASDEVITTGVVLVGELQVDDDGGRAAGSGRRVRLGSASRCRSMRSVGWASG